MDFSWYIKSNYVHEELRMEIVMNELQLFAQKHEDGLYSHENVAGIQLVDTTYLVRRLQRVQSFKCSV